MVCMTSGCVYATRHPAGHAIVNYGPLRSQATNTRTTWFISIRDTIIFLLGTRVWGLRPPRHVGYDLRALSNHDNLWTKCVFTLCVGDLEWSIALVLEFGGGELSRFLSHTAWERQSIYLTDNTQIDNIQRMISHWPPI